MAARLHRILNNPGRALGSRSSQGLERWIHAHVCFSVLRWLSWFQAGHAGIIHTRRRNAREIFLAIGNIFLNISL
jgi:hypothetical protein